MPDAASTPQIRPRLRWLAMRLPRIPDGTIEAILAFFVTLLPLSSYARYMASDRLGFVVELLLCATVAAIGRWPVQASMVAAAFMTSMLALPLESKRPSLIVMLVVVASLGARGYRWLRFGIAAWFFVVFLIIDNTPPQPLSQALPGTILMALMTVAAWLVGSAIHAISRERVRGRVDRTTAVQAQRRSIARDLHDTVAYSTTSIILRAEQAKLRGVSDPEVLADLDYIISAGRNSMRDLRGMMETLRRNDPDTTDAPHSPWRIDSLDDVLRARTAHLRSHGFTVSSHVDADPSQLPESVRETLGKVLTEATSNMVKHGDPSAPVSIMIESGYDDIEAVFINRPRPGRSSRVHAAQLGLLGARERVEALGGEVQVTSESPNWVVRVLIPLGA